MQTARIKKLSTSLLLTPLLFLATLPASAQYQNQRQDNQPYPTQRQDNQYNQNYPNQRRDNQTYPNQRQDNQYNNQNSYQRRDDRDRRVNQGYYSGIQDGGRGGNYDRNPNVTYTQNDARYHQPGGIGPGKGAAIGAAGGAILGALFGGGLKGAVIGGAAGAGVGAVVGKVHQNSQRNTYNQRGTYQNNQGNGYPTSNGNNSQYGRRDNY